MTRFVLCASCHFRLNRSTSEIVKSSFFQISVKEKITCHSQRGALFIMRLVKIRELANQSTENILDMRGKAVQLKSFVSRDTTFLSDPAHILLTQSRDDNNACRLVVFQRAKRSYNQQRSEQRLRHGAIPPHFRSCEV